LRKFELCKNEWVIVEQLHSILKVLKDATLFFSYSTPNLAIVIPMMNHINQELKTYSHDWNYLLFICSSITLAKWTLNYHYSCTDTSEVYQIVMVHHPRHKLSYLKTACWPDRWIKTA
ncbi:hypothetical protein J3A83DRAFT_4055157, partial [Scleroderma citrinum]